MAILYPHSSTYCARDRFNSCSFPVRYAGKDCFWNEFRPVAEKLQWCLSYETAARRKQSILVERMRTVSGGVRGSFFQTAGKIALGTEWFDPKGRERGAWNKTNGYYFACKCIQGLTCKAF